MNQTNKKKTNKKEFIKKNEKHIVKKVSLIVNAIKRPKTKLLDFYFVPFLLFQILAKYWLWDFSAVVYAAL